MIEDSKNIIIKTANNPIPGQTLIPHCVLWNDNLSFACRGIRGTILSFENGMTLNDLIDHFPDPENETMKAMEEAIDSGFVRKERGVYKGHITLNDLENFKP